MVTPLTLCGVCQGRNWQVGGLRPLHCEIYYKKYTQITKHLICYRLKTPENTASRFIFSCKYVVQLVKNNLRVGSRN